MEASEIESILKGDILLVSQDQFYLLLIVMIIIMTIHFLFYKQFSFVSFDSETAAAHGYNVRFWELLLYITIGIGISITTRIVGDVFVFGFLIIPTISAIMIAKRVNNIILISILIGIISPIVGLFLAFKFDFPAGPVTVAFGFLILILSSIIKRIAILRTD
jgi:zinc transport system permease protein